MGWKRKAEREESEEGGTNEKGESSSSSSSHSVVLDAFASIHLWGGKGYRGEDREQEKESVGVGAWTTFVLIVLGMPLVTVAYQPAASARLVYSFLVQED